MPDAQIPLKATMENSLTGLPKNFQRLHPVPGEATIKMDWVVLDIEQATLSEGTTRRWQRIITGA